MRRAPVQAYRRLAGIALCCLLVAMLVPVHLLLRANASPSALAHGLQRAIVTPTPNSDATPHALIRIRANVSLGPWPTFHQDPAHHGQGIATGPQSASSYSWRYLTGGNILSSPVIGSDGTVYVGSTDDKLYAINPDSTLQWAILLDGEVNSSATVVPNPGGSGEVVYVGTTAGSIYAIQAGVTPSVIWKTTFGNGFISSTAYANGYVYVYVAFDGGHIYAINAITGVSTYSYTMAGSASAAPAVGPDGSVYVADYNGVLAALTSTLSLQWSYAAGSAIESSPAIGADGTVYFGSNNGNIYAVTPPASGSTGTLAWSYHTGGAVGSSPAIGVDGTVYVGSNDGSLYALNANGSLEWATPTGALVYSSPALGADGTVYVGNFNGTLSAIDGTSGAVKWQYTNPTGAQFQSSSAIDQNGTVYIGGFDGYLYAFAGAGAPPTATPTITDTPSVTPTASPTGTNTPRPTVTSTPIIVVSGDAVGQWPEYRGGPTRTGDSAYVGPQSYAPLWHYAAGVVYSSPAIGADGTIYVAGGNRLYAMNPDGSLKWLYTVGAVIDSSPALTTYTSNGTSGTLVVFAENAGGCVYAVEDTGSGPVRLWAKCLNNARIYSSPVIANGAIYLGSYDDSIYKFDPVTGVNTHFTTGGAIYSSPAVGPDGTVYVGSNDGNLYALTSNLALKWSFAANGAVSSTPMVAPNGTIYFTSAARTLYAVTPPSSGSTGVLKWQEAIDGNESSPTLAPNGTILAGTQVGVIDVADKGSTCAIQWTATVGGTVTANITIGADGLAYVGDSNGIMHAYNSATGAQQWQASISSAGITSNAAIDSNGTMYFGSNDLSIYAVAGPNTPATMTPTVTLTATITKTPTVTHTRTPTFTPSVSNTPTVTNTPTFTPSITPTPTISSTPTITATSAHTNTMTPTMTPTRTTTPTPGGPTDTPTPTPGGPTNTPTPTSTIAPTRTATPTPTPTATTPAGTLTALATLTPIPTATRTSTMTPAPTATATNSPTPTNTGTPTFTPTVTPTPTPTATATNTGTPTSTDTPTTTPTPVDTATPTATALPGAWHTTNWVDMVGTSGADGSLLKTATTSAWDAGAVSAEEIQSGDGGVQTTVAANTIYLMVGLSNATGHTTYDPSNMDFGFYLHPSDHLLYVREGGASKLLVGPYSTGDVLNVQVLGGQVQYFQNGAVVYRSTATPVYPLVVDAAIESPDGQLSNTQIYALDLGAVPTWTPTP